MSLPAVALQDTSHEYAFAAACDSLIDELAQMIQTFPPAMRLVLCGELIYFIAVPVCGDAVHAYLSEVLEVEYRTYADVEDKNSRLLGTAEEMLSLPPLGDAIDIYEAADITEEQLNVLKHFQTRFLDLVAGHRIGLGAAISKLCEAAGAWVPDIAANVLTGTSYHPCPEWLFRSEAARRARKLGKEQLDASELEELRGWLSA